MRPGRHAASHSHPRGYARRVAVAVSAVLVAIGLWFGTSTLRVQPRAPGNRALDLGAAIRALPGKAGEGASPYRLATDKAATRGSRRTSSLRDRRENAKALSGGRIPAAPLPGARTSHKTNSTRSHQSKPTLFGASASTLGALAQVTSQFGHLPIVRIYYPGLPSANAWTTGVPAAARSAVIVSFKAQPGAILSGSDDAALAHFFDTAPTGHPVYYSYYHEPEDNIAAGQFTLSAYKAAWRHIVALANAAHNPYLHATLILMAWDLNPLSGRHWKNYLPGGGIISTLGWDAYPAGTVADVHPQLTPPPGFMGQAVAASRSVHLPFGFAEFGLATPAGRPTWLTRVAGYLRTSGAVFGTYFDSPLWPSIHLSDHTSIEMWRRMVQNSSRG